MKWQIIAAGLLLTACAPKGLQEMCQEGERVSEEICQLLEDCQNVEDVKERSAKLRKKFHMLVDLMIRAKECQMQLPLQEKAAFSDGRVSDSLKEQLIRIYSMEGGRAIIESIERESLEKLDLFDKKIQNQAKKRSSS